MRIPDSLHGTPAGHRLGCRGAECANWHTDLMTCAEAAQRYKRDYAYIRQVDAGTATAAKEVFEKAAPRIVKETPAASKKRARKTVKAKAIRRQGAKAVDSNGRHGSKMQADRGCVADCPEEALGRDSCQTVRAAQLKRDNARAQARRDARKLEGLLGSIPAVGPLRHGTRFGARNGCDTIDACPEKAAGRLSCVEVRRGLDNAYTAKRRAVRDAALVAA